MADGGLTPEREAASIDEARLDVRFAGYCTMCDRLVERNADGSCPGGHPPDMVAGRIVLVDDEPVPRLPRFNLGAFLVPFIWGPAHGQWAGAFFLPIWLFADSVVASASGAGVIGVAAATVVVTLTLAFEVFFAKRANGVAFRRVCQRMSVGEFVRRERVWALASVPIAAGLITWVLWFHLVFERALSR